jgi:hypothetical protein
MIGSLEHANENFLLHRKVCAGCRTHAGLCRVGMELIAAWTHYLRGDTPEEYSKRLEEAAHDFKSMKAVA